MFRKLLGRTITTVISKKSPPQNTRSFSTSDVETWIKIYKKMQSEAGKITRNSIENVKSEINSSMSGLKTDIGVVKMDVIALKTDIAGIRADFTDFKTNINTDKQLDNEIHNQFNEFRKQASRNVKIILAGMFGVSAASVAANHFIETKLHTRHNDVASSILTTKKP